MRKALFVFFCVVLSLVGCGNKDEEKIAVNSPAKNSTEMATNDEIIKEYVTKFLFDGYSKYYIVNGVEIEFLEKKILNSQIEAIILATMNSNVPPKDPETVPYIMEAKKKAQEETDPQRKKILQHEYETMAKEYGKPSDTNFQFKLTANLIDGQIDRNTIQLFYAVDYGKSVSYQPAEEKLK